MTTTIPQEVMAAFNQHQATAQEMDAQTGDGFLGWAPAAGKSQNVLVGATVEYGDLWKAKDDGQQIRGLTVQFQWQTFQHAEYGDKSWNGSPFKVPDPSFKKYWTPKEGKKTTACKMELGRLKGFIETILGRPMGNLGTDVQEIVAKADEGTYICELNLQYDDYGRREYCSALLGGGGA